MPSVDLWRYVRRDRLICFLTDGSQADSREGLQRSLCQFESLFLFGYSILYRYNGAVIVERSILLGTPVIYASINYRLNG